MKVLVATEKPFAKVAVDGIREVVEKAGYQLVLLEKYTAKEQLLTAVVDADALIIRSDNVDAEVLAVAGDEPLVLRNRNALLLNAPVLDIGYECFEGFAGKAKKNVSPLMKKSLIQMLRELAHPDVLGENVGTTLFTTTKGETVLMAIDYTPFDNMEHIKRSAIVSINIDGIKDIASDREIVQVRDHAGELRELRFDILPHETVFIRFLERRVEK